MSPPLNPRERPARITKSADAAWDTLVKQDAAALKPGGYLIARSMLRETLAFKSDLHFDRETVELEDASPLCPVVWIGKKIG